MGDASKIFSRKSVAENRSGAKFIITVILRKMQLNVLEIRIHTFHFRFIGSRITNSYFQRYSMKVESKLQKCSAVLQNTDHILINVHKICRQMRPTEFKIGKYWRIG